MAGDIHFRPIEPSDIDYIASNLCEGERMTILDALGPVEVKDIVAKSVLMSERCEVAARDTDRKPLCVIGVIRTSLLESEGYVWMIATPEAFRPSRALCARAGGTLSDCPRLIRFLRTTRSPGEPAVIAGESSRGGYDL